MLPQRIVRSSILRPNIGAPRCLPTVQRRAFLPASLSDRKVFDAKYPERQTMTETEDPGMVRSSPRRSSSSFSLLSLASVV